MLGGRKNTSNRQAFSIFIYIIYREDCFSFGRSVHEEYFVEPSTDKRLNTKYFPNRENKDQTKPSLSVSSSRASKAYNNCQVCTLKSC